MNKLNLKSKYSFTLVELMVVLAILALLAGIVIFVVKPGNILDNVKDTTRVSDLNNISKSINYLNTIQLGLLNLGSPTTVYVSLPDNTSTTCSSYPLPSLPTGYTYTCKNSTDYRKNDSNGWIPINFRESDNSNILSSLPIDPVNNITYYYTYFPGGSFELTAQLTKGRDSSINDNGNSTLLYETGTPNHVGTPVVRESSLIGYWKFDEGTGTVVKGTGSLGTSINGTFNGTGTKWALVTGTNESVGIFNGISDYIPTSAFTIPNINGQLTISAWVNWGVPTSTAAIIADANENNTTGFVWLYRHATADSLRFEYANGTNYATLISSNFFTTYNNVWVLATVAVDYNNKNAKFYRNGILFDTKTSATPMLFPNVNNTKCLGSYNSSVTSYGIVGYLDDVRLYNRALTADEIMGLYNQRKGRYGL